jgi:cell division septal protein FtsQ
MNRFGRTGSSDRTEQEAQRRKARANQHLDRVRNRRVGEPKTSRVALPFPVPRFVPLVAVPVLAVVLGVWVGDDALAQLGGAWHVSKIEVQGATHLTGPEIAQAARIALGDGYNAADPRRLAGSLRQNAWIAEAGAARLPGGTVVLRVREREPLAVIEGRGGPLGVDAEGRPFAVLDPSQAQNLPRLRCENTPPPGEADPRIAEAIRVARSFPSRGLALPREIALGKEQDPEGLVLRLPGMEARFVFGAKDLDARVGMLAELLAKRPAEVAEAASVDLRFLGQAVLSGKNDAKGSA